jgi:hypothetical protein
MNETRFSEESFERRVELARSLYESLNMHLEELGLYAKLRSCILRPEVIQFHPLKERSENVDRYTRFLRERKA